MKPFAFSLEKVLKVRAYHEDEAKIALGIAVGALAALEDRIRAVAVERVKAAAAQFSSENSAAMMQQYMFYITRLDNTKERLLEEAALAEMKVEAAREAFLEASRERKVLDRLREKRQKEHRKKQLDEETKVLDETAAGAPARRGAAV